MFQLFLNKYLSFIDRKISVFVSDNPFTNLYGLARSLLALSTLSIFVFNYPEYIFDESTFKLVSNSSGFYSTINLFVIFGWDNLSYAIFAASLVLICVISGYFPKITCLLQWWIAYSLHTAGTILDGGDQINSILTALIVPVVLLDNRKNHWYKSKVEISDYRKIVGHFIFLLISLQMSFLYFHAAVEKIYGTEEWINGTALYYIFNGTFFGLDKPYYNFFGYFVESNFVIVMTWSVLILELYLSYVFMSLRKRKFLAFYLAVIFHFFIAYFFGLISFGLSMTAGLMLYTLPYEWLNVSLKRLKFISMSLKKRYRSKS